MSTAPSYLFLPWLRRGLATGINNFDGTHASAQVSVHLEAQGGGAPAVDSTVNLPLSGPGEVIGLHPGAVVHTWPARDAHDVEGHAFPSIELRPADLPWRFTPYQPDAAGRLRPWLCLIVLTEDEIWSRAASDGKQPLPTVTVKSEASLPSLDQCWAWAHVQVIRADSGNVDVKNLVRSDPRATLARLLCPRRLKRKTAYTAFVVPTFERGRLAGCGKTPGTVPAPTLAWEATRTGNLELPIYYEWRFNTGEERAFEDWVKLLRPRAVPREAGARQLVLGADLAAGLKLALEGALLPLPPEALTPVAPPPAAAAPAPAPMALVDPRMDKLQRNLADLLNPAAFQANGPDPIVTPPLYGQRHVQRDSVDPGHAGDVWFDELNLDPRWRVVAALGTQVVQADHEALMASAWQQIGQVKAANEKLRYGQLALAVSTQVHDRHLAGMDHDAFLQVTSPLHARIPYPSEKEKEKTVEARLDASPLGVGVLEPVWRRVARPLGPLGRRQGRPELAAKLVAELVAPPSLMKSLETPGGASRCLLPPPKLAPAMVTETMLAGKLSAPGALPPPAAPPGDRAVPGPPAVAGQIKDVAVGPIHLENVILAALSAPIADTVRGVVNQAIRPADTIVASLRAQIDGIDLSEKLHPVMAVPDFPRPMYEAVRDLGQDWLVPGIDRIPPDTVCLMRANRCFVEAFLVGLNQQMARELLWNEYPTDQRGTPFRHFWNRAGVTPPARDVGPSDINPIADWDKSKLGGHVGRSQRPDGAGAGSDDDPVVLLVRGEVFRRHPAAAVHLVQAPIAPGPDARRISLPKTELPSSFSGTLRPDFSFFGFDLTVGELLKDPNWCFVFQEHPSEVRFGLREGKANDPAPKGWSDLSWRDLGPGGNADAVVYIDRAGKLPTTDPSWAPGDKVVAWHDGDRKPTAADYAFITLQRPVRVVVPASDLLRAPPENPASDLLPTTRDSQSKDSR